MFIQAPPLLVLCSLHPATICAEPDSHSGGAWLIHPVISGGQIALEDGPYEVPRSFGVVVYLDCLLSNR